MLPVWQLPALGSTVTVMSTILMGKLGLMAGEVWLTDIVRLKLSLPLLNVTAAG